MEGLEPPYLTASDPKSDVSTNFTTSGYYKIPRTEDAKIQISTKGKKIQKSKPGHFFNPQLPTPDSRLPTPDSRLFLKGCKGRAFPQL